MKQLSTVEKDTITNVIIDYDVGGAKVDLGDPTINSLIEKGILIEMPTGKFRIGLSILAQFDSYLAQVGQLRIGEMSQMENPVMTAVKENAGR